MKTKIILKSFDELNLENLQLGMAPARAASGEGAVPTAMPPNFALVKADAPDRWRPVPARSVVALVRPASE
jgi:hypothetical protein